MSYNLLSGSVFFEGATPGTIEDIVDTHTTQTISGKKTITTLTSSLTHISSRLQVGGTHATNHAVNINGALSGSGNISGSAFYANGVLLSTGGAVTALNNRAESRLVTIGATTTELDGEANLTFNGTVLDFKATSISGSGNISGSAFYGNWAGATILGSQVQLASAKGIQDDSGLALNVAGLATATPAGGNTVIIDQGAGAKKCTVTNLMANAPVSDASALGNSGRVLLDGGVGTISTNANLSFGGTPLMLTVNSSLNVDSNTLFVSASNNRVGIGTITPATPLEIFQAGTQLQLSYNASDNATFEVDDNGYLYITPSGGKTVIKNDLIVRDDVSNDTVVQIYDSSDDGVISGYANNSITTTIHANGSTFFNGGNVGIGTNTPNTLLEISASTGSQLKLTNTTAKAAEFTVAANGDLTINPTGSVTIDSSLLVNGNTTLGDASGDNLTINGTVISIPNDININSNHMFLDQSTKFVGIGTNTPEHHLSVSGNVGISGSVNLKNPTSGSLAGAGSYLGLDINGNIILTSSAGGAGAVSAVANGADNRVATFSSADALNGEANLTFDGTDLGVSAKIFHVGDVDTFINFTDDDINIQVGGVNMIDITEDGSQDEITLNEGGVDVDFRVESVNDSHLLFVDASNDAVSIGVSTDAPAAVLEVAGDAAQGKATLTVTHAEDTNNAVNITADSITTAKALRISADALTTGNALYIDDDSSSTGTRNTAIVIQNHTGAINATALAVQSDGGAKGIDIDKNYSDLAEASIVGLNIDWDKTGASTTSNTMYGIQLDMDNTTATNGANYMYGLHVTPTLTHAADAGSSYVYGALINAQGGTNGTSLVQGARIEAGGGDINYGIQLDVEDGGVDLRIESSADSGDYFQIQTTTHGATTITTVDDDATAAHLTFNVDGNITLDPAGGNVAVDGKLGINRATPVDALHVSGAFKAEQDGMYAFMSGSQFQISASSTFAGGGKSLFEVRSPTHANLFSVVEGGMIASNIVPAAFNANLYINGPAVLGAPATPIHNNNLHSGSVTFYLDEGNSKLFFRVKDSIGQVKSGSVSLS